MNEKKKVLISEKPLNGVTLLKETERFMDGLGEKLPPARRVYPPP